MSQLPSGFPPQPQTNVNVAVMADRSAPPFLVRAIWFVFIGSWLGGVVIALGYLLLPWIITTPLSFWLFNRIGTAMTLRPRTMEWDVDSSSGTMQVRHRRIKQRPWWARIIWFVFIGSWLGLIWLTLAYIFCLLILTWPIGMMMIDRAAGVITLERH